MPRTEKEAAFARGTAHACTCFWTHWKQSRWLGSDSRQRWWLWWQAQTWSGKEKKVCSGLHLWKSQFQYKKIRERERMFQQYCGMFCGTVCARKNPTAKNQQQRMHGILFTPFLAESSVLTSPAAEFKAASCQTDLPKNGINERVCSYEYIN